MFWAFLTIQFGRFFILGHGIKKGYKFSSLKKVSIQGWLKLAQFLLIELWGLPSFHSIISDISPYRGRAKRGVCVASGLLGIIENLTNVLVQQKTSTSAHFISILNI